MVRHPLTTVDQALDAGTIGILAMLVLDDGRAVPARAALARSSPSPPPRSTCSRPTTSSTRSHYHYWIVPAGAVAVAGAIGAGAGRRGAAPAGGCAWGRGSGRACSCCSPLQWVERDQPRRSGSSGRSRGDRQAVLDAIPDGARVAAPMHALSHLSERTHLFVLPEPLIPVRVGTEWGAAERERATRELEYVVFDPAMRFWGAPTVAQVEQEIERRGFREVMRRGETRLYRREPGSMTPSAIALIGARSGSERVPGKNVRRLAGHPLLAYAIETAPSERASSTASSSPRTARQIAKVARWYGADVPFLRPDEFATSTSPDIEWIAWTLPRLGRALRPLRDRARDEPVPRAGRDPAGPRAAPRDARGRLDPGRRARQAAPGEDVGADDRRPHDDAAPRPVAPRRRLACGPVPGAAAGLRPEQRARDRLDARRRGEPARGRGACSRRS